MTYKVNSKEAIIRKYEEMMYRIGEYDIWEDDIAPKLDSLSAQQIRKMYLDDKKYYEAREKAGGFWG